MKAFSLELLIIISVAYILALLSILPGKKTLDRKLARDKPSHPRNMDRTSGLMPLPPRNEAIEEE